jgi:PAS domain S-box-containing protein
MEQPEVPALGAAPTLSLQSIPSVADLAAVDWVLDAMGMGIFEYDPASELYRFSCRCKALWGFAVEDEPTPESIISRVHPDDRQVAAPVWKASAPDRPAHYSIEHRIVLPDGSIRWVCVTGHTAFSDSGGARRAVREHGAMCDITSRKVAERQLYEHISQQKAFLDGAPVAFAIFDRAMRYVACSRRYLEDRKLTAGDLLGRTVYEVFPRTEQWRPAHMRALGGQPQRSDVDIFVRPDGTREWVRWQMRPWYSADEEVGGIVLLADFITNRMLELQEQRESQARLELAIHAGAMGTFDYDMLERRIAWDSRTRRLWGVSPDERITRARFLRGIHPDDRDRVDKRLREIVRAGGEGIIAIEFRVVNPKDGSICWILATGRVYFEGGRAVRMTGVVQDITDRKSTELALAQTAKELRRADECKDVFLATLSHELRNPLAPIRTAVEVLASPKLTPEQLVWIIQVIRRQTGHMALLLDDLLEVTRISRGKLTLRKEAVRLSDVAQSAIESARPLIDERNHRLLVSLCAESTTLHADPLRLSQVLWNLLMNAAKYTAPGGQIELNATVEQAVVVIRVKDNGIGIPQESIAKIFTLFWQDEKASHSQGGLGIGLPCAKGIVQLHGGTIEARSDGPGCGAEFIVRLPICGTAAPLPAARREATEVA